MLNHSVFCVAYDENFLQVQDKLLLDDRLSKLATCEDDSLFSLSLQALLQRISANEVISIFMVIKPTSLYSSHAPFTGRREVVEIE